MNERILLHLRRYYTTNKEVEAPQAVTQKGIADAIDIRVTHVPRSVKKLDEEGLIYESVMHIEGMDKRRKAYFLTDKGMYNANEIKRNIEERRVPFKDLQEKVKDLKIDEIADITGIKIDVLDLIRLVDREGILNQKSIESYVKSSEQDITTKDTRLFDFPHKVPRQKQFVGRKKEVETLMDWLRNDDIVFISVNGNAGIGKTSLVAKAIYDFGKDVNVFWFDYQKGEGYDEMVEYLSEFLTRLSRTELKTVLKAKKKSARDILRGTITSISGTSSLLVMDSFDEADNESKRFILGLSQELNELSGSKIIILNRLLEKQIAKGLADSKFVKTIKLKGLDRQSCKTLFGKKKLKKDEFEEIFRLTEGNPMAVKLIKSEDVSHLEKSGKFTKDELMLIKYLKSFDKI